MADTTFVDVENKEIVTQPATGTESTNSRQMAIGQGSRVFRADESGIWLGAEKWANAPFRVDMDGNVVATSATFSDYSKVYIFAQDAIPTSGAIGDLWIDTNDSNKLYRAESVGADAVATGEWVLMADQRATDALLKSGASQVLSGDFNLNDGNVKIDGANKRILISDGTNDRILIGYQSGGF